MMPTNRGGTVGSKESSISSTEVAEFVLQLKGLCELYLLQTQSIRRVFRVVAEVAELRNIYWCYMSGSLRCACIPKRIIYTCKSGYFGYFGYFPAKTGLIVKKSPQLGFPTVGFALKVATRSATFH